MSDDPSFEYGDVDRDGIPDVLDLQIDPPPSDLMSMKHESLKNIAKNLRG